MCVKFTWWFYVWYFTGYEGTNCERDINECVLLNNPCGHGKCNNTDGGYVCICDNNKCGYDCNFDDPCLKDPCIYGACEQACTNITDYKCNCFDDYVGKNCTETEVGTFMLYQISFLALSCF